MTKKIFTLFIAATLLFANKANAGNTYVSPSGGALGTSGADWDHAAVGNAYFSSLNGSTPAAGTHIYIMQGNYMINNSSYIWLNNNDILMQGGFSSSSSGTNITQYNPTNYPTKITVTNYLFGGTSASSANAIEIKGIVFDGTGGSGFIYGTSSGAFGALKFTDLSVTNFANGSSPFTFNNSGSATFTNCYFSGNGSSFGGAVMYNASSNMPLFINNCSFVGNAAGNSIGAGAIYSLGNSGSTVTVTNSNFCNNTGSLGTLANAGNTVVYWVISGCTFSNNTNTSSGGGAITNSGGHIKVTNSNFYGNKAQAGGGAIRSDFYSASTPDSIVNCVFYNNKNLGDPGSAGHGGGAIDFYQQGPGCYVGSSSFIANAVPTSSNGGGGAISFYNVNLTTAKLDNCTFYKNTVNGSSTASGADFYTIAYYSGPTYSYTVNNSTVQLGAGTYAAQSASPTFTGTTTFSNTTNYNGLDTASFSNYSCKTSTQILPVTFTGFTAIFQSSTVKLNWATATETNNKGFAVECSSDGINFTQIAFINSEANNGNSNAALYYTTIDPNPQAGTNYYRLKQVDFDGNFAYSSIATVYIGAGKTMSIGVYPNPVSAGSKVIVGGITNFSSAYITIVNGIGQTLQQLPVSQSVIKIDFNSLPHGIYHLKYTDAAGNQLQTKVVK